MAEENRSHTQISGMTKAKNSFKKNRRKPANGREGVPVTKREISFGLVPVVILRGFPL